MALTPVSAISEILRVINNQNRSTEALLWLQETLREIQGIGRWRFHRVAKEITFSRYLALPSDFDEAIAPVLLDTSTSATSTWTAPSTPWEDEDVNRLYAQKGDFRFDDAAIGGTGYNIIFHSRWTTGKVLLRYYRQMTIPSSGSSTTAIDLPDEFVYRLCVYGAARHGLMGEDDYDRLAYAEKMFSQALNDMITKYGRSKVANEGALLGGSMTSDREALVAFPDTYSIT